MTIALKQSGATLSPQEIQSIISEIDLDENGVVSFGEFLTVLGRVKDMKSERPRILKVIQGMEERNRVGIERSGGGV